MPAAATPDDGEPPDPEPETGLEEKYTVAQAIDHIGERVQGFRRENLPVILQSLRFCCISWLETAPGRVCKKQPGSSPRPD